MRTWRKVVNEVKVLRRARENRTDLLKHLLRRPAFLASTAAMESAVMVSSSVDTRTKMLAQVKVSALVGCGF